MKVYVLLIAILPPVADAVGLCLSSLPRCSGRGRSACNQAEHCFYDSNCINPSGGSGTTTCSSQCRLLPEFDFNCHCHNGSESACNDASGCLWQSNVDAKPSNTDQTASPHGGRTDNVPIVSPGQPPAAAPAQPPPECRQQNGGGPSPVEVPSTDGDNQGVNGESAALKTNTLSMMSLIVAIASYCI